MPRLCGAFVYARSLFGMSARGKKALFGLKEWCSQKATLSRVHGFPRVYLLILRAL